jgi:hypothetical protein
MMSIENAATASDTATTRDGRQQPARGRMRTVYFEDGDDMVPVQFYGCPGIKYSRRDNGEHVLSWKSVLLWSGIDRPTAEERADICSQVQELIRGGWAMPQPKARALNTPTPTREERPRSTDRTPFTIDDHLGLELPQVDREPSDGRAPSRRYFPIEMLDDIELHTEPTDLVRGILPMGPALGVCFGPPKSLKSFMLVHLGLHIADNREYCGRAVQGGIVAYVTGEGLHGARRRLIAARREMGMEGRGVPFVLVPVMPNLGNGAGDRAALERDIRAALDSAGLTGPVRMIGFDTVRRSMPGKSENKIEDMSVWVENAEHISRTFNCLVMGVHHSPRSDETRGSGSNSLDAACDVMLGVVRDEATGISTVRVAEFKDGEEGDTWSFGLRQVQIGVARDGSPISSCTVNILTEPARKSAGAKATSADKLPPAQRRLYDIIVQAVAETGKADLAGELAPRGTIAISRDTLKKYTKRGGWWDTTDKTTDKNSAGRFSNTLIALAGKHVIGVTAEHLWLSGAA